MNEIDFEALSPEEKQKLWEMWKKAKQKKREQKPKEKPKPKYKAYFPLGEGQGISVSVWENNIQLQRRVRDENGNWKTEQEIALARPILEKLYIRLPYLFRLMRGQDGDTGR